MSHMEGQKTQLKGQTIFYKTWHWKLKIKLQTPNEQHGVYSDAQEEYDVSAQH